MKNLIIVAVPTDEIRKELSLATKDIAKVSWLKPEEYHITLTFVGEVEDEVAEKIATSLSNIDIPVFETSLGGLGIFQNRDKGISYLWTGAQNLDSFLELRNKINIKLSEKNVSHHVSENFTPHVTIALLDSLNDEIFADYIKENKDCSFSKFKISEFIIYESLNPDDFNRVYKPYSIIKLKDEERGI